MHPILIAVMLLALAACTAGSKALPRPDGQVFRLNPDRWPETVNDIPALPAQTVLR